MSDGSLYEKSYPANAFEIEGAIYNYLKEYHPELGDGQNPDALKLIEQNYHDMKLHCLYRIRRALEEHDLYNSTGDLELRYKFKPRVDEDKIDVEIPTSIFNDKILPEYIKKIELTFDDFKRAKINNDTITAVFLSGKCCRRDYVQNLAKTVFGGDIIFPSLGVVPNEIASIGRSVVKCANNSSIISNISNRYVNEIINQNYRIMEKKFIVPEKEEIEYVIGIDFGHGETSAAICRIDENRDPEDIDLTGTGGKKAIPSTIYIENNDGVEDIYIGKDAIDKYGKGGKGDFYAYFKQSLEDLDETRNPLIRVMRLFMSEVYKTICCLRSSELMEGNKIKRNHVVFIACPSQSQKWGETAMNNYVTLALNAGLPIVGASLDNKFCISGIVRESRAAYIRMLQKKEVVRKATKGILVIDFGSSTIDITYYKEGEEPIDKGYSIGAAIVEQNIQQYLKEYHPELDEGQNPNALKLIEQEYPYVNTDCLYKIRRSKETFYEDISTANCIEVRYKFKPRVDEDRIDVEIPTSILNDKILPEYIKKVRLAFEDFQNNVINNNTITLMVLTGGASRMDFVKSLARSVFGEAADIIPPQDPSLTVSNGIATAGRSDLLLYYLAKDLFEKKQSSVYYSVKTTAIDNICKLLYNTLESVYYDFYAGSWYSYRSYTLNELEDVVKNRLNDLKGSFYTEVNKAFRSKVESRINAEYRTQIKNYIDEHFPHYDITSIMEYSLPTSVAINIDAGDLDTIGTVIFDSVLENADGLFMFLGKAALNLYLDSLKTAVTLIENGSKLIGNLWNKYVEGNNKRYEYADLEKRLKEDRIEYNDKNTYLDSKARKAVYDTFTSNKSKYEESLKVEITNKLPSFENECNRSQQSAIEEYVVSEINKIQLQIK